MLQAPPNNKNMPTLLLSHKDLQKTEQLSQQAQPSKTILKCRRKEINNESESAIKQLCMQVYVK